MEDYIIAETSRVIFLLIRVWSVISEATENALVRLIWLISLVDVTDLAICLELRPQEGG